MYIIIWTIYCQYPGISDGQTGRSLHSDPRLRAGRNRERPFLIWCPHDDKPTHRVRKTVPSQNQLKRQSLDYVDLGTYRVFGHSSIVFQFRSYIVYLKSSLWHVIRF